MRTAIKNHGFKNLREAEDWGKAHIARTMSDEETGGKGIIRISRNAIEKFCSSSAVNQSSSLDAHLSVLSVLPEVIHDGIIAESHPDYPKDENGNRSPKNGPGNPNITIHVLYGAVDIDGILHRVKVTLKEDKSSGTATGAYSYEATKIELLENEKELPTGLTGQAVTSPRNSDNSISAAKLLKNVESSKYPGKKLLDFSQIVDENGEPMVVYHGTPRQFNKFSRNEIKRGNGFWFTEDESYAIDYSLPEDGDEEGRVISAYLNIKNPATLSDVNGKLLEDLRENVGADMSPEAFLRDKNASDFLRSQGYDGLVWDDIKIAFFPNQIKSATDNDGSFSEENDDIRFSISNQSNDIFYSNAERAVEGIKQEKSTPAQWLAMIEKAGGLKAVLTALS